MTTENKYKTEEKNNKINGLNCPHIEMKLIQYSVTTVWNCFVSVSFQCVYSFSV